MNKLHKFAAIPMQEKTPISSIYYIAISRLSLKADKIYRVYKIIFFQYSMMLNQTQIISSPKFDFCYPTFVFSPSITSNCPVFTFIPCLLVPCKKGNSYCNQHCYKNHCFELWQNFMAITLCQLRYKIVNSSFYPDYCHQSLLSETSNINNI